MCSAQNFGETVTGRPVASAASRVGSSRPLAWRSSPIRRPPPATPSNTVRQKSQLPSGTPPSPCTRKVSPPIFGHASSRSLHGVAAVRGVRVRREPFDRLVRGRAVDPLVRVRPQAELDVQADRVRLLRQEPERRQVAFALLVGELRDADVVPGDGQQEGVGEVQVGVGHAPVEVVAEPEREAEPVEALRDEHREVAAPEPFVAEPGEVLHLAAEQPRDAPNLVGRPPRDRLFDTERAHRVERRARRGRPARAPRRRDRGRRRRSRSFARPSRHRSRCRTPPPRRSPAETDPRSRQRRPRRPPTVRPGRRLEPPAPRATARRPGRPGPTPRRGPAGRGPARPRSSRRLDVGRDHRVGRRDRAERTNAGRSRSRSGMALGSCSEVADA